MRLLTCVLIVIALPVLTSLAGAQGVAKKVKVGDGVVLEIDGDRRRVLVDAYVCLRQGQLEQLLTRKRTKEHEAILATEADARTIHAALVAAGAVPGSPVKFRPTFEAPRGTPIKITLQYEDQGKTVRVPAQKWLRGAKNKKSLDTDWVFGGSILIPDLFDKTKPPAYAANDGDVICISNFDTAMLDVPFNSSKDNDDLAFEANTDVIPRVEAPVLVILEPVLAKKK